ncbi:hypothetical protein CSKR_202508 [Clonorchis sinensis]|uniref:Uncharacterized protein n=1 Tax=Clonorchis sinensis TaxID=79923 RepID=A0A8T1MX15_CLOSI|nr:hypothetical protein CSKR_202508 [Clonorchis sinensis]
MDNPLRVSQNYCKQAISPDAGDGINVADVTAVDAAEEDVVSEGESTEHTTVTKAYYCVEDDHHVQVVAIDDHVDTFIDRRGAGEYADVEDGDCGGYGFDLVMGNCVTSIDVSIVHVPQYGLGACKIDSEFT